MNILYFNKEDAMKKNDKIQYNFIRVPDKDMDLLMQTVLWDGTYDVQLAKDIENAMGNIEYISEPWIVFSLDPEHLTQAHIFVNEESAKAYIAENNEKKKLSCMKADFYS